MLAIWGSCVLLKNLESDRQAPLVYNTRVPRIQTWVSCLSVRDETTLNTPFLDNPAHRASLGAETTADSPNPRKPHTCWPSKNSKS